jgi:hypothetical protein
VEPVAVVTCRSNQGRSGARSQGPSSRGSPFVPPPDREAAAARPRLRVSRPGLDRLYGPNQTTPGGVPGAIIHSRPDPCSERPRSVTCVSRAAGGGNVISIDADPRSASIETWARQPGEAPKPWAAFCVYQDMDPAPRSLSKVAQQLGKSKVLLDVAEPSAGDQPIGLGAAFTLAPPAASLTES